MDKYEVRKAFGLSKTEFAEAEKIFKSVNQSKRIEYIEKLKEAGFNSRKIRAVSREPKLRFERNTAARELHIQKVAEVIFDSPEDFRDLQHFAACAVDVLRLCGYIAKKNHLIHQLKNFEERINNAKRD